jgi:hypothetical protein
MTGITGTIELECKILSYLVKFYSPILRSVCRLWRDLILIKNGNFLSYVHSSLIRKEENLISYYLSYYPSVNFSGEKAIIPLLLTNDVNYISKMLAKMNISLVNSTKSLFISISNHSRFIKIDTLKYVIDTGLPVLNLCCREIVRYFLLKPKLIEWMIEENYINYTQCDFSELCTCISPYYINRVLSRRGKFSDLGIHYSILGGNLEALNYLLTAGYRYNSPYNLVFGSCLNSSNQIEMINSLSSFEISPNDEEWSNISDVEVLKHLISLGYPIKTVYCVLSGEPEIIDYLVSENLIELSSDLYYYVNNDSKYSLLDYLLSKGIQWPGDILWNDKFLELQDRLEDGEEITDVDSDGVYMLEGYSRHGCPITTVVREWCTALSLSESINFLNKMGFP